MTANDANLRLQSQVQRVNRDGQTASTSPTTIPRQGATPTSSHPATRLQEQPLLGPP